MKMYAAQLEQDEDGVWCGRVVLGPKSCAYSNGPTIERARENLREAVAAGVDCAVDEVQIELEVKLSARAKRLMRDAQTASHRAEEARTKSTEAIRKAAQALTAQGLSLRDVGSLLGVTRQRVSQILSQGDERSRGAG
jgi:predicted RNase H-like HicB family nuclease